MFLLNALSKRPPRFRRAAAAVRAARLAEPRRFVQVVAGPRQVGKTNALAARRALHRKLLVGGDGIAVADFLSAPVSRWFET